MQHNQALILARAKAWSIARRYMQTPVATRISTKKVNLIIVLSLLLMSCSDEKENTSTSAGQEQPSANMSETNQEEESTETSIYQSIAGAWVFQFKAGRYQFSETSQCEGPWLDASFGFIIDLNGIGFIDKNNDMSYDSEIITVQEYDSDTGAIFITGNSRERPIFLNGLINASGDSMLASNKIALGSPDCLLGTKIRSL